jgi:hypothetical protein
VLREGLSNDGDLHAINNSMESIKSLSQMMMKKGREGEDNNILMILKKK